MRPRYLGNRIALDFAGGLEIIVPTSALANLAGFRAWATSDTFPEIGRYSYVDRELFIDMSSEETETHNKVKLAVTSGVVLVNEEIDLGELYADRALVTNDAAWLSTEPDGTLVTWECSLAGRVRPEPRKGAIGQFMEMHGSPDWILEVVSNSSIKKDT